MVCILFIIRFVARTLRDVLVNTSSGTLVAFFLFGARDVWFVVGVPIFLHEVIGWGFMQVGTFMACWVIGYGCVQALAPRVIRRSDDGRIFYPRSPLVQSWLDHKKQGVSGTYLEKMSLVLGNKTTTHTQCKKGRSRPAFFNIHARDV